MLRIFTKHESGAEPSARETDQKGATSLSRYALLSGLLRRLRVAVPVRMLRIAIGTEPLTEQGPG